MQSAPKTKFHILDQMNEGFTDHANPCLGYTNAILLRKRYMCSHHSAKITGNQEKQEQTFTEVLQNELSGGTICSQKTDVHYKTNPQKHNHEDHLLL